MPMNNSQIKWRILKALNALYENRKTPSTILSDGFVDYLTHTRRLLRRKLSNANYLEPCNGFAAYYEKNFKTDFQNAEQFLSAAGLEHDARRSYTLNDINTLQFIAANKSELQQSLTTLRTFSSRVFTYGGSKYLETHRSLLEAVYQLLEIEQFPAEDPKILQWRFVVDCPDARNIVLCENLNFLKTPRIARDNHIELWYVGGNNISNIDYIPAHKLTLPPLLLLRLGLRRPENLRTPARPFRPEIEIHHPTLPFPHPAQIRRFPGTQQPLETRPALFRPDPIRLQPGSHFAHPGFDRPGRMGGRRDL